MIPTGWIPTVTSARANPPRLVQVVAQVLAVTVRTVELDWRKARAFLYPELSRR